ncbi:MAG: two-component system cell cycle sensor histidine kinase/response regulator CckA [Desulforhopalus sp.]|jgi:two-component system cell cycle sensor histidine kinase/response regulator CckA
MRFRITVGIMFIISILFFFFAKIAIIEQRARILDQIENYGTEVTRFIAKISIVPLQKFSIYQIENYAFQFEQGKLIAFCNIYDHKGALLTSKNAVVAKKISDTSQRDAPHIRIFSADIDENGIHYGRVDVGLHVDSVYSDMDRTSFYIIMAFCFAVLVIGGAVSFFIHRQLVRPILKLSKTTRTIAGGEFVTSEISQRKDEVGALAGAINLMSGSLEESYRTLEKNVDERTAELYHAKNMAEKSNHHLQIVGVEIQALLDNSPVGIVFVTNDYNILRVNKEFFRITGYKSDELVGKSMRLLCSNILSFEEFISSSSQFDEDGLFNRRTELQKKDGSIISCAVRGRKTILGSGIERIVLNFEDITSQLLIEEELLKIKKLESVRVLASGIAHDFNNILVAILGNLSLVERLTEKDKHVGSLLAEARKASLRAKDLTEKLLSFAKGSEPDARVEKLSDLLKKSVPMALLGSSVDCDFDLEEGLWKVKMDKIQIDNVIQSIVLNAKEAMEGEGRITISCRNQQLAKKEITTLTKGRYVKITVADTGPGIDVSVLENVFDPYFSTKEKDSNKGSGLGLSIVLSILVKHKGAVFMDSEPGRGSRVTIYLPAAPDETAPIKIPEQLLPTGKGSVVLADDDKAVHELADEMLSYLGYEYVACNSLEDAVKKVGGVARKTEGNIIVLIASSLVGDMAKGNIAEMFKSVADQIKLVVCHGNDSMTHIEEYLRCGFDNDLKKPFQLLDLSRALSTASKES